MNVVSIRWKVVKGDVLLFKWLVFNFHFVCSLLNWTVLQAESQKAGILGILDTEEHL